MNFGGRSFVCVLPKSRFDLRGEISGSRGLKSSAARGNPAANPGKSGFDLRGEKI